MMYSMDMSQIKMIVCLSKQLIKVSFINIENLVVWKPYDWAIELQHELLFNRKDISEFNMDRNVRLK